MTDLHLTFNKIGDAGAKAITAALRTNRSLTDLYLGNGAIPGSALYLMIEAYDNKIGEAGEKALRKAVDGKRVVREKGHSLGDSFNLDLNLQGPTRG